MVGEHARVLEEIRFIIKSNLFGVVRAFRQEVGGFIVLGGVYCLQLRVKKVQR